MLLHQFRRFFSINVAIVGSGPAGFYTAQKLVNKSNIKVDIYEKLPVPFGLVRYGVAPDHADVKNVIKSFTTTATSGRVNFYGNVSLGEAVKLQDLIQAYHVVVLCYGSAQDKLLGIEGERSKNLVPARKFVGWYNGLPEDKNLDINLDCDTACIVGQGNVALDCARILTKPANLAKTDITKYAADVISRSRIKRIYIIGRRGPIQVSFTTKELRELIELSNGGARLEPSSIFSDAKITIDELKTLQRGRRRLTELLLNLSAVGDSCSTKFNGVECIFKFLSKPVRIVADESGQVKRLELQRTQFENQADYMNEVAHPTDLDQYESIDCGLIIRSIGYKAVMVDSSLPINHKTGSVLNQEGRIQGHKNLYCSGWLATGASGVIAGTLNSSLTTAKSILNDIDSNRLPNLSHPKPGYEHIENLLKKRSVQVVHFNEWLRIDELERRLGQSLGKTREKFVEVEQMLDVAKGKLDDR